jgi:hypothetical protein
MVRLFECIPGWNDRAVADATLIEFSQAFWAQSIDLKLQHVWRPQSASDFPKRIYEALSATLDQPPDELANLMGKLIAAWKQQAGEVLTRSGYQAER